MNGADLALAALRSVHVAALISLFGTVMFTAVVVRTLPVAPWACRVHARLARLGQSSLALALIGGAAWFVVQAAVIANAQGPHDALAALPPVLLETQFGRLLLLRLALLLALWLVCRAYIRRPAGGVRGRWTLSPAIILAGSALALQAATSHAGALGGAAGQGLMLAEALHVIAAGAWLGGLAPLLIVLAAMPAGAAAVAARRFFPLGLTAVSLIALTSLIQAVALVGSLPALVGTAYGRTALFKLLLFALLLVLAALNRLLFSAKPGAGLRRSIMAETALAGLLLLAAGSMAQLTPGAHEQAVWPFSWRINPHTAGGVFIPAYPTSFFVSPTGFAADAVVRGDLVFQAQCAACHGAAGQGDGPAARTLPAAPADLTARRVLDYGDGDLFWLTGHAVRLGDEDRWDLVDAIRARNRGEFVRTAGLGAHPLRIPRFTAACADGRSVDSDDLRGRVLRIVVASDREPGRTTPEPGPHAATIILPADAAPADVGVEPAAAWPDGEPCTAQPEARAAFAILLGTSSAKLAGSQLLIDANGWLRARWRPGEPGGWATDALLQTRVQAMAAHPLPADPETGHAHHH